VSIDLHSQTTASDGELSPEVLLARAQAQGVRVLSVTDHDTVAALERAEAAARVVGIELVPGIEISAHLGAREVHLLGHFVDRRQPALQQMDAELGRAREERMREMIRRLAEEGVQVTMEQVQAVAQGAHLGRPHLARALVALGHCSSMQEAFQRYLGDGRPGHVPSRRISAEDAVALIHRSGGTATVAHPGVSKLQEPELGALKAAGLDGLEVFHPEHVPSQREKLLRWAERYDLVPTAGSDFHGPKVSPGRELGEESLAVERLERLRSRARVGTL
jgi:predicted metal-dependent phosphoesterase TrpH